MKWASNSKAPPDVLSLYTFRMELRVSCLLLISVWWMKSNRTLLSFLKVTSPMGLPPVVGTGTLLFSHYDGRSRRSPAALLFSARRLAVKVAAELQDLMPLWSMVHQPGNWQELQSLIELCCLHQVICAPLVSCIVLLVCVTFLESWNFPVDHFEIHFFASSFGSRVVYACIKTHKEACA